MMMLVAIQKMLAQPCAALLQDSEAMQVRTATELCAARQGGNSITNSIKSWAVLHTF
jgi:hypothetical protein